MYTKVLSTNLKVGMFVSDLDRPWIDTPFPLEGFLIEDSQQIAQLQRYCASVMVDRTRSLGGEYQAAPQYVSSPRAGVFLPTESGRFDLREQDFQATAPAKPRERRSIFERAREFLNARIPSKSAREHFDDDAHRGIDPGKPEESARPTFLSGVPHTIYADASSVEEEFPPASDAYKRSSTALHHLVHDIRVGKTLAIEEVEDVIYDMVDSMVRNPDALMWVARMREQDVATYGHGLLVAVYLIAFGRHLGFPKDHLAHLGLVGMLLDVGKLKLPRELLEKKARYSDEEFAAVQEHVRLGLDLLAQTPNLHADVLEGIAQHHERENGSGYPAGLVAEKICMFGRMSAIADCFTALTNKRPYAEATSAYVALRSMSEWGGEYFHGPMVEQFIQAVGVFPVGSLVELSSGEVALIVSHNKVRRLKPRLLIITGPDKSPSPHPTIRDLLYDPKIVGETLTYIRRGLPAGAYGLDISEFYPA